MSNNTNKILAKVTMLLSVTVLLLLMVFGLVMRAAQGGIIELDPAFFYQLMTAHGTGMVGVAGLMGAAILWYFIGRHVELIAAIYLAFLTLFLIGVVFILGSIFIGGYGGGWTFLYPLPAISGGAWDVTASASFYLGYLFIGVGFLLLYIEVGRKLISKYGSISKALAWPLAFGKGKQEDAPPPAVVAAMATIIFNSIGIVVGAAVIVSSLINLLVPGFAVDALLAKNMIYFFGHVFINASIYMSVIAVYEIIPEYTGRSWKTSRIFAIAWTAVLLFVMAVYPHHMLQDTVMPSWMLILGQVTSYLSGIPLLAVTVYSLCTYIRGSNMRWDLASSLLVLSIFGWSLGAIPAILDAMISVNKVMHNTQWVPGHFHFYLILGDVAMAFGFMAWLTKSKNETSLSGTDKLALTTYILGGVGFALMFLVSGALSVPRRWAVHLEEWMLQDRIATVFALLVVAGTIFFMTFFIRALAQKQRG